MKPFSYLVVEFFDKGVSFSWRACRDFSTGYTCVDSMIGPFMGTIGTTTPLVAYDERGIYLLGCHQFWVAALVG